jgi:hypothetical protein
LNEKRPAQFSPPPPGRVPAAPRLRHEAEHLAHESERAGVGRGVGARRATDRALVDGDQLVDRLRTLDRAVGPRLGGGAIEPACQCPVEDLLDERRFARSRHPGHRGESAPGDRDVDVPQVPGPGAEDADPSPWGAPVGGNRHRELAPEVAAGEAAVDGGGRARVHEPSPPHARSLPEVDHPVRGPYRLLVVLDDDDRVPAVADRAQRLEEPLVVALVEPDRRLVEDVHEALHARPDLRGETKAVGLSSRERRRGPIERQVAQPERGEHVQTGEDLTHEPLPYGALPLLEGESGHGRSRLGQGKAHEVGQRAAAHLHREALRAQARAAAGAAGLLREVGSEVLERLAAVTLFVGGGGIETEQGVHATAEIGDDAGEAGAVAEEEDLAGLRRKLADRGVEGEAVSLRHVVEGVTEDPWPMTLPGTDRALQDAAALVGDHTGRVHRPPLPQPVAARARPLGAVEGERLGAQRGHGDVAAGAGQPPAHQLLAPPFERDEDDAVGETERLLQAGPEPTGRARTEDQPIHEDVDAVAATGIERRQVVKVHRPSVDAGTEEPGAAGGGELLAVGPLPAPRDGGGDHHHSARGPALQPLRDLLGGLGGNGVAAAGAVRPTEGGEEDPQMVVDLGDRPHGGAGMGDGRALLDGDGGRQAAHRFDVRPLHLLEELAGPRREALDEAPLPLRVQGVEGQAALARPRRAGDDHQPVPGDVAVDSLQVVDPGTPDGDGFVPEFVFHDRSNSPF